MARDGDSPAPTTEVTLSRTAELLFAANVVASTAERTGVDASWVRAQRAQLSAETLALVPRFAGFWWPTMGLVDFLCWNGLFHDPEAFLADVLQTPVERYLQVLFNDDLAPEDVAALLTRPETARTLGDRLSHFSAATADDLEALFRDPEGHRAALVALVRGSNTALFRQGLNALPAEAETAIHTLERRLTAEDPVLVAESLRGKPLRGPSSYSRVTFVPSRLIGHRYIQCWGNGNGVFFLQLGAVNLTGPTQTGAELAEFLKVLADPTRMDILRLLCCGPSFGKEIAASLGLTTATVSRHLDQLKAAGLVKEERADTNNVKRLRFAPEALNGQFERLKTYLLQT